MQDTEFINWLREQSLLPSVEKYFSCCKRVFSECLRATKQEVLIITDLGHPQKQCSALLAGCYLLAARRLNLPHKLVIQQPRPIEGPAPTDVEEALSSLPPKSLLVMALSEKLRKLKQNEKFYRRYAQQNNHRFVSTSGLRDLENKYFSKLASSIDVDYEDMQKRGALLKSAIDYAQDIHIITDKGTNLFASIKGKTAVSNDGNYSTSGGNIPAGEVYIAPRGKHVEGKIVIDGTIRHSQGTSLVKEPVTLTVQKGEIIEIAGGPEAKLVEETFEQVAQKAKYPWGIRRLGEIGIGINTKASLIPVTIVSEKALGTAHVGIGSNSWFGGTIHATSHYDFVFTKPRIYLDNKKIGSFI